MQKRFTRMYSNNKHVVAYMVTVCFLVFSIFLGVSIGTFPISFFDILQMIGDALFHMGGNGSVDENTQNIVMSIRLPRVILAGLVGASLALAGASFQGLLQNPLADPYTLGVSSGASLGAVFVLFFRDSHSVFRIFYIAGSQYFNRIHDDNFCDFFRRND